MPAKKKKEYKVSINDFDTYTTACEGVDVVINQPDKKEPIDVTGEGDYVTFTMYGMDSPQFRTARGKLFTRLMALREAQDGELSSEDNQNLDIEFVGACIKGWKNVIFRDENTGELREMEFSPENAQIVLKIMPYACEQLSNFISNRTNFMKR